jgi:hypothetical protein
MVAQNRSKVDFPGKAVSEKESWNNFSKACLNTWCEIKGARDDAAKEAAKKEFLELVKDDKKTISDATGFTDDMLHNYDQWGISIRDKWSGSAEEFCNHADASSPIQIYRVLFAQWDSPSEIELSNKYTAILNENFEYRPQNPSTYESQLALWLGSMRTRLGKLSKFCPNKEAREAICFTRLSTGMPEAFSTVCNAIRTSRPTVDEALSRLQDEAINLKSSGKLESNVAKTYYTDEELVEIRKKAFHQGKNEVKKTNKKQRKADARAAASSFYAAGGDRPRGNGKGKGKGKGEGKGGKGKGKGKGKRQYDKILQCAYCHAKFHDSAHCWKKKADEAANGGHGVDNREVVIR